MTDLRPHTPSDRKGLPGMPIALLVAGLVLGFSAAKLMEVTKTPPKAPAPTNSASKAQAKPGAKAASGPKHLLLKEEALKLSGIGLEAPMDGPLADEIDRTGLVVPKPGSEAVISAPAGGLIVRLYQAKGAKVRQGEPLALVQSPDAASLIAAARSAKARSSLAEATLNREKNLLDQGITTRAAFEQVRLEAETARIEAERANRTLTSLNVSADGRGFVVKSPIAGQILSTQASLGKYASTDGELFRVIDPKGLQVELSISGEDLKALGPKTTARLIGPRGEDLEAKLTQLPTGLSSATGQASLVLQPSTQALSQLLSGQSLRVILSTPRSETAKGVRLKRAAVLDIDGKPSVFVRTKTGFDILQVVLGQQTDTSVEILSPLPSGALIATKNAFLLKAELSKAEGGDE